MTNIPAKFAASTDREACSLVATLRSAENVVLLKNNRGEYRTAILRPSEVADAEIIPYDPELGWDGFRQVAELHRGCDETVVAVY